jgi:hypothetical protein
MPLHRAVTRDEFFDQRLERVALKLIIGNNHERN